MCGLYSMGKDWKLKLASGFPDNMLTSVQRSLATVKCSHESGDGATV